MEIEVWRLDSAENKLNLLAKIDRMAEVLSKINLSLCVKEREIIFSKSCNFNLKPQSTDFLRKTFVLRTSSSSQFSTSTISNAAQTSVGILGKGNKWWEKGLKGNMKEVRSASELVESLKEAGDKLVVVDFFSPACGGCKALHPKICQLAEMNPEVEFIQINYEEQKSMCYSLNVHVLPFFRFYRGAHGRLSSFSCTNATINKFKNALAKYSPAQCSLGPTKGLEEKELIALSSNTDLDFTYTPKPLPLDEDNVEPIPATPIFLQCDDAPSTTQHKTMLISG